MRSSPRRQVQAGQGADRQIQLQPQRHGPQPERDSFQGHRHGAGGRGQPLLQQRVLRLLDGQGRATARDEELFLQLEGDGQLLGIENGRPDDLTPYAEKRRTTLDGRAVAYVRAGRLKGALRLHAFTQGGLRARCEMALVD